MTFLKMDMSERKTLQFNLRQIHTHIFIIFNTSHNYSSINRLPTFNQKAQYASSSGNKAYTAIQN